MWKLSPFTIFENLPDGVLIKNTFTEAVMHLDHEAKRNLDHWLSNQKTATLPNVANDLIGHGFLIEGSVDEFADWYAFMLSTRNEKAHVFTLHVRADSPMPARVSVLF